jgi:crotonobetainyl-CoA:carnitine CoA-transferase CaiB-like acyl-CoA transferase
MSADRAAGPLSPYRILDLTTEDGWLAGKVLADLGADVVKIEPAGGDPRRARPSHAPQVPGADVSLPWLAENRGKRTVTLDLESPDGRSLLLRLIAGAHAALESSGPGRMESLGLGFDELAAVNPRIVLTRISAFGQSGPYAGYAASDLIRSAIGGASWLNGDKDRPPVRITAPQYYRHAAVEAVAHTCAALYHARETGIGQQVDVSAQLATVRTLMDGFIHAYTNGTLIEREVFGAPQPNYPVPSLFRCADGYVMAIIGFRPGLAGYLAWTQEEGATLPPSLASLTQEVLDSGPDIFNRQPANFVPDDSHPQRSWRSGVRRQPGDLERDAAPSPQSGALLRGRHRGRAESAAGLHRRRDQRANHRGRGRGSGSGPPLITPALTDGGTANAQTCH